MARGPVVLEIGGFSTKVGFAGDEVPRHFFFTIVGTPKYISIGHGFEGEQVKVGDEITNMGLYRITRPVSRGQITDFVAYEQVARKCFDLLGVDPAGLDVALVVHPMLDSTEQARLLDVMQGTLGAGTVYLVPDAAAILTSGGFDTGIVVDVGAGGTRVTPCYQGYVLDQAITCIDELSGDVLTTRMQGVLQSRGVPISTTADTELARSIKEIACMTSLDPRGDARRATALSRTFELPDGRTVVLDTDRVSVPEVLFQPGLAQLECDGIHLQVLNTIEKCDIDVRADLYATIIVAGGSTLFPRFMERLEAELKRVLLVDMGRHVMVNVIGTPDRIISAFKGTSILATTRSIQQFHATR